MSDKPCAFCAYGEHYENIDATIIAERDAARDEAYALREEVKRVREIVEAAKVDHEYMASENVKLIAERDALRFELEQQSELVQRDWLSPVEAAGLKREIDRLRAELAQAQDANINYAMNVCPEQDRLIAQLKSERDAMMTKTYLYNKERDEAIVMALSLSRRRDELQAELAQAQEAIKQIAEYVEYLNQGNFSPGDLPMLAKTTRAALAGKDGGE